MYKHNPASRLLLLLVLLLLIQLPTIVPLVHRCLMRDVALECAAGQVILVESAFLGVSEGHDPATGSCPKTSDKCHQSTPRVAQLCNRRHTCSLAYPRDTVIYLQNGCGLTNYVEVTFTCIQVSGAINICGWSGVVGEVTSYIVNDEYPNVIPTQPHICQCTIQRAPDSTAPTTGVALIVRDVYFTGSNCQQKLYMEFPGHSTQNSTVCSGSQRVIGRTIFSRSSIQNGEIISLTFDKLASIVDGGTFVIEAQVTSLVAIKCSTSARPPSTPTQIVPTHWTSTGLMTNNPTIPPESTAGIPQSSLVQHSKTTAAPFASSAATNSNEPETAQTYLIVGATVGGVALILIILAAVFIVWRKRRHRKLPNETDPAVSSSTSNEQASVRGSNLHRNSSVYLNDNEAQFADSLQVYAVFPNQVISNDDTLRETPSSQDDSTEEQKPNEKRPRMTSGMGDTIFIAQTSDPSDGKDELHAQ